MDFPIDRLYPYATTPPDVIRTVPISHQLQPARQNQLHRCVPFVAVVSWIICFVLWVPGYSWYYCPEVDCYALIWNQLVLVHKKTANQEKVNEREKPKKRETTNERTKENPPGITVIKNFTEGIW